MKWASLLVAIIETLRIFRINFPQLKILCLHFKLKNSTRLPTTPAKAKPMKAASSDLLVASCIWIQNNQEWVSKHPAEQETGPTQRLLKRRSMIRAIFQASLVAMWTMRSTLISTIRRLRYRRRIIKLLKAHTTKWVWWMLIPHRDNWPPNVEVGYTI